MAALGGLTLGLVVVVVVAASYAAQAAQGVAAAPLPVLGGVTATIGPRFLFSINGPTQPLGVAVAPSGDRVYVTESGGARETKVFDRDGRQVGTLVPPNVDAASRSPVYAAVGPTGLVYVSDRQARAVHVYAPDGVYSGQMAPPVPDSAAWQPLALAFDPNGNLLVSNVAPDDHGIYMLAPDGRVLHRWTSEGSGPGEFSFPNGVAADRDGNVFVSDSNNGRVVAFSAHGAPLWTVGRGSTTGGLSLPRGLVVDDGGRVYVADTIDQVVKVFDVSGKPPRLLSTLGGPGVSDGQFAFPNGLALDRSARLYVTDRENNRVQVWTW